VAPSVTPDIERAGVEIARRSFAPSDLDGVWLVIAAATPEVNREVAAAAESRHLFVNAVDDPENASAFLSGVVRRDGVVMAVSTSGAAPALTALLREALDDLLPADLERWMEEARHQRSIWRSDRTPMPERKPRLLEALNRLYESARPQAPGSKPRATPSRPKAQRAEPQVEPHRGHVSLVGAGPGNPALLTRQAIARLRAADLVLYDALIDDRILRYARRAQRFFAGKRAGRRAMTQEVIHSVMIRAARRGRRVVRLKGGDPFVFGRGGEEAQALRQAGVPFDVSPGVSSAIAAPALAGIPVTHRGLSSAFLVVSGHEETAFTSAVGALQPNGLTLIVLMGVARAAAIATTLVEKGWSRDTPAALVADASAANQRTWCGTLAQLAEKGAAPLVEKRGGASFPGTIIIGDVVTLASEQDANEVAATRHERKHVSRA
jgi:uroporphyrin-III C-methyltransferase/precorrin-2 dehydrogenase/sirohydrochlorin ferrochelatase